MSILVFVVCKDAKVCFDDRILRVFDRFDFLWCWISRARE